MKTTKYILTLVLALILFSPNTYSQKKPEKSDKDKKEKTYSDIITDKAITDEGLFYVHKVDEKYYYEIHDSLLDRDMLMVTRIAKMAKEIPLGAHKLSEQVLSWQKFDKNLLLKELSFSNYASDSLPIKEAVSNSNFEPIIASFKIEVENKDRNTYVIDVTNLYKSDVKSFGYPQSYRKRNKISSLDTKLSFIESIRSFPLNIEAKHIKTYKSSDAKNGQISMLLNNSMILLPKKPMKRRYFDERVGWFTTSQTDYGIDNQEAETVTYLDRWRLEVKDEDIEKFKNGELVEPKKPIVYYIDRATPKKWRKYLKQGIEDWNAAFEEAGFKNAVICKDPPTKEEDPDWSPEDVRYSTVRYLASSTLNANGPHVSDPRSGEIIESDINWYHNVMSLLHNWFFIQTAAINPDARGNNFKTETMGELIKFVSSHELGHTLGLPHNMGSSSAYPVDSLRSARFTNKFGTAPSIMDYARFNYVAQPEDKGVALMPNIGIYDKYAISWGYRPILDTDAKDEKPVLDSWILKHAGDPLYRFGHQQATGVVDPSSQTEDLGDNAMKASMYGIKNLKRILPNLEEWTSEKGENYDNLSTMYGQVLSQFNRYMGHVTSNIGGVYEHFKTSDQKGAVYTHVDKATQKEALNFVIDQLFKTPTWMLDKNIFSKTEFSGSVERVRGLQSKTLNNILDPGRMARMIENETSNGHKSYSLVSMMTDLRKGVWSEIYSKKSIDTYRRNLQRVYLDRLDYLLNKAKNQRGKNGGYYKSSGININQSDVKSVARGELKRIKRDVKSASQRGNTLTRYHLQDVVDRIDTILDPK